MQYTFDLQDLTGHGTGVGCSKGYVVGFQATKGTSGYTVKQTQMLLNTTGSVASNGPTTTVVTKAAASDPRVKTASDGLRAQLDRSLEIVQDLARSADALQRVRKARASAPPDEPTARELASQELRLSTLNGRLASLYAVLQEADAAPTPAAVQAGQELGRDLAAALAAVPAAR